MNCKTVALCLNQYLDGEIDQATALALKNHLDGCETCREELSRLEKISEFFADPEPVELPVSFHARVIAEAYRCQRSAQFGVFDILNDLAGWWRSAGQGLRLSVVSAAMCGVVLGLLLGGNLLPEPLQQSTDFFVEAGEVYSLDFLGDSPRGSLTEVYNSMVDLREGEGE